MVFYIMNGNLRFKNNALVKMKLKSESLKAEYRLSN